ncbi:GPI mannosyltransferase 2 [Bombardia bombarda]|uniref:GPI mannosyltransferase 2 n=1 Tax=Bombardia bombarda TaxID=252184 RepID=A0AA40C826_9PEZI|nr:GPI mannosyltransferase 2 [Bombardia bombarda]
MSSNLFSQERVAPPRPVEPPQPAQARPPPRPYRTIIAAFAAWKFFLLAIAAGSSYVGDAYDTSADLLLNNNHNNTVDGSTSNYLGKFASRLTSWDAIYYVTAARRSYHFEQEWAFGSGLPTVIRTILNLLNNFGLDLTTTSDDGSGNPLPEALTGILVAHTAHLLSALVLYRLTLLIFRGNSKLALVTALLHIISPAGVFLSAPYAESGCALLSFTGYLLYAQSCLAESKSTLKRDGYVMLAGISFGLATVFRSNALLNGIPFAWEVLQHLPRLFTAITTTMNTPSDSAVSTIRRLFALGFGGAAVAAGSIVPQAVAYQRFCGGGFPFLSTSSDAAAEPRLWCQGYMPSIYTFVQQHYWDTGFLRYWKLPNLPLFLLAGPMLAILVKSGVEQLLSSSSTTGRRLHVVAATVDKGNDKPPAESARRLLTLVRSAAAAQVLLAVLAVSTYHVQIITRISSGYPLWYWWLAGSLIDGEKLGGRIVVFMVLYASIQGVLFTSFLPPA